MDNQLATAPLVVFADTAACTNCRQYEASIVTDGLVAIAEAEDGTALSGFSRTGSKISTPCRRSGNYPGWGDWDCEGTFEWDLSAMAGWHATTDDDRNYLAHGEKIES